MKSEGVKVRFEAESSEMHMTHQSQDQIEKDLLTLTFTLKIKLDK